MLLDQRWSLRRTNKASSQPCGRTNLAERVLMSATAVSDSPDLGLVHRPDIAAGIADKSISMDSLSGR
jgi:hypothetical protein